MQRILVIGSNGMLGHAAVKFFTRKGWAVVGLTRREFDVATDPWEKLRPHLEKTDVVINCVGVIKPMIAPSPIETTLRVNSIFPRNLARLAQRENKMCVHITTDCVYSGKKGKYTENDYFDAEDVYGMSKNGGETAESMVLRTSIIGEEHGTNRSLVEWAKSLRGKQVNGYTNHLWNGVTTVFLAEIVESIIRGGLYQNGIFHVFSKQTVTKHELLSMLNDAYDLGLSIRQFSAAESCDRSLATVFPLNDVVSQKSLRQQIEEMVLFFAQAAG